MISEPVVLKHHRKTPIKIKKTLSDKNVPLTLRETTRAVLRNYFNHIGKDDPINFYPMLLEEVERPMIEEIYEYTHGHQINMAKFLGISRGKLRSMLKRYGLLNGKKQKIEK